MKAPSSTPAYWGLAAVIFIWGFNFSVVKAALATFDPLVFNGLRFLIAGAALWPLLRGVECPRLRREDWARLAALGIVGNTGYQLTFIYGLDATLAGNGAIILASAPIWTVLLAVLLGHEQGRPSLWLAAALGTVGIGLVMTGTEIGWGLHSPNLKGDLLLALASICWAVYTVAGRDLIRRYGAFPVTTWALWIGGLPLVLAAIPGAIAMEWSQVHLVVWAEVLFAGLGAVALAYVLWYKAVEQLGSPLTALSSNLVPCVALGVAWIWLSETPSWVQLVGTSLVASSVILARGSTIPLVTQGLAAAGPEASAPRVRAGPIRPGRRL